MSDYYDWIVLGNHPAALLSASLVSRLGLSVLILPIEPNLGVSVSQSGQYLDPEPNYLLGLGWNARDSGLVLECLKSFGLSSSEMEQITTQVCTPQILTPHSRFVLALEEEDLQYELKREFGDEVSQKVGLSEDLILAGSEYLKNWRELSRQLVFHPTANPPVNSKSGTIDIPSPFGRGRSGNQKVSAWVHSLFPEKGNSRDSSAESLEEVCAGLWYAATGTPYEDPEVNEFFQNLALSRVGGAFRGGMSAYRKFLLKLATRQGAHLDVDADCKRVFIEKGRLAGIQIAGRKNLISARGGILGCSIDKATSRITLTGNSSPTRSPTLKKSLTPVGWRFSLSLTLAPGIEMPKLLSRAIWQEKDAPILEIETTPPADYGAYRPKFQMLHLRTLMPYSEESLTLSYQRTIAGRMVRQAMEIIPFLEAVIQSVYPDFRHRAESQELKDVYGFQSLKDIPDNLLIFTGKGLGSVTGIEGLFVASEESYPSFGSLGPTIAAMEAVSWLARQV